MELKTLVVLLATTTSLSVYAEYVSSHSCSEPYKPYQFTTQYEVDTYNDETEEFRTCIEDYIEEQNDAVRDHQRAAEDAIDDWNNFANS
jgi:predicted HicB family RNase H-like nuclease